MRTIHEPGKFEGELELTRILYDAVHLYDDEASDGCGGGWAGLIRGPIDADALEDLTEEERQFIAELSGAILYETPRGFVYADYYRDDATALERDWKLAVAEFQDDAL